MKKFSKISFGAIVVIAMVSATSCSVEYRARHPRPVRQKKVIVVGMAEPAVPVDKSTVANFSHGLPVSGKDAAVINKTK